MTRGRRPEPEAVQAAKGNPGKRRRARAGDIPDIADVEGAPPAQLNEAAQKIWTYQAPDMVRMKLLRRIDALSFCRYCVLVARWFDWNERLQRLPPTYWTESAHGKLKRGEPLFAMQDRLGKLIADLEDRFGITPAARQRILMQMAARPAELPFGDPPAASEDGAAVDGPAPEAPPTESPVGLLARSSGSVH